MRTNFLIFAFAIASITPAYAAEKDGASEAQKFASVRTFSLPNLPADKLKSELFRKANGNVVMADIVDLNLDFVKGHGKPSFMPPQMAPQTSTIILKFPDGWWTMNMVRSDGNGSFLCRVSVSLFEPKPDEKDFSKYVFWCQAALTLSVLDPAILSGGSAGE